MFYLRIAARNFSRISSRASRDNFRKTKIPPPIHSRVSYCKVVSLRPSFLLLFVRSPLFPPILMILPRIDRGASLRLFHPSLQKSEISTTLWTILPKRRCAFPTLSSHPCKMVRLWINIWVYPRDIIPHPSAGKLERFFPPLSLFDRGKIAYASWHQRREISGGGGTGSIQLSETKLFNARGRGPSKRHVCGSWHRPIDIGAWHRVTPPSKKYILHGCCDALRGWRAWLFYLT